MHEVNMTTARAVTRRQKDVRIGCRTLKMCHGCRWRAACSARCVTAVVVVHYRLVGLGGSRHSSHDCPILNP